MSKYTTEVRFICESLAGFDESKGFNDVDEVIANSREKIFNFSYPIFDENYRETLETKILRHFYTREISEEVVGLWKLRLYDRLNMIMPYFNQLYESALIKFNPLYDTDYTREHTMNKNENNTEERSGSKTGNTSTSTTENNSTDTKTHNTFNSQDNDFNAYSDTPQGSLDNVKNNQYLTNATKDEKAHISLSENVGKVSNIGSQNVTGNNTETNTLSSNGTINNLEQYVEHVVGNMGYTSFSKRVKEFRDTFLNIDALVIGELETLFFGLW